MGRPGTGVELRPSSIRIKFTLEGVRQQVRLDLKPTAANAKFAHRLALDVNRAIAAGVFEWQKFFPDHVQSGASNGKSVRDYGERWFDSKGGLAGHSRSQYRNALDFVYRMKVGASLLADMEVTKVRHSELAALVGGYQWSGPKRKNNALIPLRGLFGMAARDHRGMDNPMEGIENDSVQAGSPDPFTLDEVEMILKDLRDHYSEQVVNYFEFAFFSGLRPEEEIALLWSDLDLGQKPHARIERARSYRGETKALKTYHGRDVELTDRAVAVLFRQRKHTQMKAHGHVFENPVTEKPWHDDRSQRDEYWAKVFPRTKIRARAPYKTRHTFAALFLMAGARPTWVSRQMGHKNAQMLFTVYAKWIDGSDRSAEINKMNQAFGKAA